MNDLETGPMVRGATLSPCGTYRYMLQRRWNGPHDHGSEVVWIMLNPSTADADVDDPTIRRCVAFSRSWGYRALTVVNLFGLRSTDPAELLRHPDPVGEANDTIIEVAATSAYAGVVVAAWGAHPAVRSRGLIVRDRLAARGVAVHRLGAPTKDGRPRHPLYVKGDTPLEVWAA